MKKKSLGLVTCILSLGILSTTAFAAVYGPAQDRYDRWYNTDEGYAVNVVASGPSKYVCAATKTNSTFDSLSVNIHDNELDDYDYYNEKNDTKNVSATHYVYGSCDLTISHEASDSDKGYFYCEIDLER